MKGLIRKILHVRKNETIRDYFFRMKTNISKLFYKNKYSSDDIKKVFSDLGIQKGDNLMVHSSWRSFYNFKGTPNDMLELLMNAIGKQGTLAMPCYGDNKFLFDVDNDKSAAGVLSELLRKDKKSIRSKGPHFSCVAHGMNADKITKEHYLSKYGFDSFSPYYKFVMLENSKILMAGLGKNPVKLSLYHLVEMININLPFYKKLFKKRYSCIVKYKKNNKQIEKKYDDLLEREATVPYKKNIKKIYSQSFCSHIKISNVDFYLLDAKKALNYIIEKSKDNKHMIKLKRI